MSGTNTIGEAKKALREQVRAGLKQLTPERRSEYSAQACSRLEEQPLWQGAKSILFYAPLPDEVDIWRLLIDAERTGKEVYLPRYGVENKGYVACRVAD